jgi:penicillin-binding protein 1C
MLSNRVFSLRVQVQRWVALLVASCWLNMAWALPSFQAVKADWRTSDKIFLDRHGIEIQRIRVDQTVRKLNWVSLDEVSPALRYAVILSEDKHFYQHSGVDWSAVAAASWSNLWNQRTRGASTLTMQLATLIDADLQKKTGRLNPWQKVSQAFTAQALEKRWSKAQILEAYLNLVSFRGEIVGLSALAATMFGKSPSGLDAHEAAIAAALLRAPNASAGQVAQRACQLLRKMKVEQACVSILGETLLAFARRGLHYQPTEQLAPHFARKLLARYPTITGTPIQTTLNADLQRYAIQVLRRHLRELNARHVEDGALLILDNASGDILAWVGSSGNLSRAEEVDGVTSVRQAGSILKPFLYQLALEGRWLTAASLLEDSPLHLPTSSGIYSPQNYTRDFKGPVSVRTALAASLNIPAVRTIEMVSPLRFRNHLVKLGMTSLTKEGDYYGYSLALGAADIQLYEITQAYQTLANLGLSREPRWLMQLPPALPVPCLSKASSFIINDILSDRTARARTFGLESALGTRFWSAVKTGTSKDMRDNWAIGYSRHYTVGVWVGNASGAPMWDVSGMHGAAPIWLAMMNYLHTPAPPSVPPTKPAGVEMRTVRFEQAIEAKRQEYFLPGTARAIIYFSPLKRQAAVAGIDSPMNGAIYALDPDIPPANQKIVFRAKGVPNPVWYLGKEKIGQGNAFAWSPWPGHYALQLRNSQGDTVQTIQFEVRGVLLTDQSSRLR